MRHLVIGGAVFKQLLEVFVDGLLLGADQAQRTCGNALGALGGIAHHQHGLAQSRGLLLDAARVGEDEVARRATRLFGNTVTPSQVQLGVAVFEELGLVETKADETQGSRVKQSVYVVEYKGKVELSDSVQYREGLDEYDSFMTFKDWVLGSSVDQLQDRIRHPLLPYDDNGEGR